MRARSCERTDVRARFYNVRTLLGDRASTHEPARKCVRARMRARTYGARLSARLCAWATAPKRTSLRFFACPYLRRTLKRTRAWAPAS